MKPRPPCLVCTFRTAYDLAKKSTDDESLQTKVVLEAAKWLASFYESETINPAGLHTHVFRIAKKITGNPDPFSRLKKFSNEQALKLLPLAEAKIKASSNVEEAFQLAVKMAICGNAIDFEVENYNFSLEKFDSQFLSCFEKEPVINHTPLLMRQLSRAEKILYLLDNAGEIVFDRLLIDLIKRTYDCEVWAAAKEKPILNDALVEDAEQTGLTSIVHVITTGNDHIGIELNSSSEEFLTRLKTSDLIIAKGQGCYETLTEIEPILNLPLCYLLRAKCPVVAEDLNVPLNSSIIKFVDPKTTAETASLAR